MTPEEMQRILGLGTLDDRAERLRQQLAYGQALRSRRAGQFSNPWAAALGGAADVASNLIGAYQERQAQKGLEALGQERAAGREAFASGLGAAEQQGKQQEAGALLSQRPFVPFATDYNAESLKMRNATAEAGTQQRRQDARSLAVLSGDPVLKQWAMMQEGGAGNDEMQRLRLEQSGQRLSLQQEAEKRKSGLLERTLSLKEQQAKQQREDKERTAAAKKVADALGVEEGLRKEVMGHPVTKAYLESQVAYDKVLNAAKLATGPGDVALVFNLMKTLDPGSTVNQGEQASASNTTNVPGQLMNAYNRLLTGERLTPEQRQEFTRAAGSALAAQEAGFQRIAEFYRAIGGRAGANVQNVLPLSVGGATRSGMPSTPAAVAAPKTAAPPVTNDEVSAAEAWLSGNPDHPDAPAVRERVTKLRAGGTQ